MLKLHSLAYSRAVRVLWLIEELGIDCDLVTYERTETFRAPAALKAIHPLGKSPVIEDRGMVIGESATILRYVNVTYGDGRFAPEPGTAEHWAHEEWLEYVEGTLALPMLLALYSKMQSNPALDTDRAKADRKTHLSRISERLADRPFLMGETPMLADMQMSYILALATVTHQLDDFPAASAYLQRIKDRPPFQRAEQRAGPMTPPFS